MMKLIGYKSKYAMFNMALILILAGLNVFILSSCSQQQKASEVSDTYGYPDQCIESEPSNLAMPNGAISDNSIQEVAGEKSDNYQTNTHFQNTSNSRYYDDGYDAGYDDGEDDAVNGNGWMGQYDNSNRYKGKSRKEYEQGYDEGYEAGYDDNYQSADE